MLSFFSQKYHLQILVENIKDRENSDFFNEKAFCAMIS